MIEEAQLHLWLFTDRQTFDRNAGLQKTQEVESDEPARLAEASLRLGLKHVVITSVTRDDLPDGGAEHFYQCVLAVRAKTGAAVEVEAIFEVTNPPTDR